VVGSEHSQAQFDDPVAAGVRPHGNVYRAMRSTRTSAPAALVADHLREQERERPASSSLAGMAVTSCWDVRAAGWDAERRRRGSPADAGRSTWLIYKAPGVIRLPSSPATNILAHLGGQSPQAIGRKQTPLDDTGKRGSER